MLLLFIICSFILHSWFVIEAHSNALQLKNVIATTITFLINPSILYPTNVYCFPRRLQCNNFSSSQTSSRRPQDVFLRRLQGVLARLLLQDVLLLASMSWRRLERQKKLHWRRFQDVFSTSSLRPSLLVTFCFFSLNNCECLIYHQLQ